MNLFCGPADQALTGMKRERRRRKNVARREDEIEKRINADLDTNMNTASILSNRESFSNISTDDSGRAISTRKQRQQQKTDRLCGSKARNEVTLVGAGTSASASHGVGVEGEDQSVPVPSNFTTQAGELERVTIKAGTQDEPQAYEGDDMDVEMSGRIAKLEM
jgi:hypothetical protein